MSKASEYAKNLGRVEKTKPHHDSACGNLRAWVTAGGEMFVDDTCGHLAGPEALKFAAWINETFGEEAGNA